MSFNGNGLTHAERERLDLLVEEMGEVAQVVGKTGRHGYLSFNPFDDNRETNKSALAKEAGHVLYALCLLMESRDVDVEEVLQSARDKSSNVRRWLHHQDSKVLEDVKHFINQHMYIGGEE